MTVRPGSCVLADCSAVVITASESVTAVLSAAEALVARENAMAAAVSFGTPMVEVLLGGAYGHLVRKLRFGVAAHWPQRH